MNVFKRSQLLCTMLYLGILVISPLFAQNSEKSELWRQIGLEYLSKKSPSKAIPYLKQAIRLSPENAVLRSELAYSYQLLDDNENSLLEYTSAIGLPGIENIEDIKFNIGLIFAKQEKWEQALLNFNDVLKINPNYTDVYLNKSLVEIRLEKYKLAETNLRKFLELQPENAQKKEIQEMIDLLAQLREFPVKSVDKSKYQQKRSLEDKLNKNRERLNVSPSNQFLGGQ